MYIFKEKGFFITEPTLHAYKKREGFEGIVESIVLTQRAQIEEHSLFSVLGQGSVMALMLKNVGYQDKVINQVETETTFNVTKALPIDKTGTMVQIAMDDEEK